MKRGTDARMVLVTCGSLREARNIAQAVVGQSLAACVNIATAPIESVYRWKGKVERAREYLLMMKTLRGRVEELEAEVARLHSYDVPEFLVVAVESGSRKYLDWLAASVAGKVRK